MQPSALRNFMIELLGEALYESHRLQDGPTIVSDNAKVRENEQATPVHPILETVNCSDSFRELFKINGGNTRWSGGSNSGSGSFRLATASQNFECADKEGVKNVNLSLAATTSSLLCPVVADPSITSKKIDGRWESSTPSPAARSRNAAASLALPRRLPEHTDSFQIISKSIRRGGIRVPSSFGRQQRTGSAKNEKKTPTSRHMKNSKQMASEEELQNDIPSLTSYLDEPPAPVQKFDPEESLDGDDDNESFASDDSSSSSHSGKELSLDETWRLSFAAHAFQEEERRFSAEASVQRLPAAITGKPRRCSSLPLTASLSRNRSSPSKRSTPDCRHQRSISSDDKDPTIHGSPQQEHIKHLCDRIAHFALDPNCSRDGLKGRRSSDPRAASIGLDNGTNVSNSTIRPQSTTDERLIFSPHSTISSSYQRHNKKEYGLHRTKNDKLEFRNTNTSAYYYAPQLQRLAENEQQNMGKLERRSIVDNSLAYFGSNETDEQLDNVGGFSPASKILNNHKDLVHDRWAPTEKNHLAEVLEQIRVRGNSSTIKDVVMQ